jgi:hypothetical protein
MAASPARLMALVATALLPTRKHEALDLKTLVAPAHDVPSLVTGADADPLIGHERAPTAGRV